MRFSLCNEVLRDLPFEEQCELAAALGYDGVEVAPFTLSNTPQHLPSGERAGMRRIADAAGVPVTGLHFLLIAPPGLSITSPDADVRSRTRQVILDLVELCGDLGGRYLVHGSPQQRAVDPGASMMAARGYAMETLAAAGEAAEQAGLVYCLEALAPEETNFVNTVAEAAALVEEAGVPGLRTMIDTSAAARTETEPIEDLARKWLPTGLIGHIHVNDRNRRGPGQGRDRFCGFLRVLAERGYSGTIGVEPFDYHPDPRTCAARAIGYLRGIEEAVLNGGE